MSVCDFNRQQLGELNRELSGARDSQISQVVAMVDGLPERGAADRLIAPLRPRLAQLRPARPLRFCRLLFTPFDPVIVPGAKWRPGSPSIPRTVLEPIAEAVRAQLGPAGAQIEAWIAGRTTTDLAIVGQAGAALWPPAARILARADAAPPQWAQTGLPDAAYGDLARAIGAVLTQATALHDLIETVTHGAPLRPEDALHILNTSSEPTPNTPSPQAPSPQAWGMKLAILLARLPQADAMLRAALASGVIGPNAVMRAVAEQAIDVVLGGLESQGGDAGPVAASELSEAGAEVTRILALLAGLDGAKSSGEQRRRVHSLRQRVVESCRARFETGLVGEFVAPLMLLRPGADPKAVTQLEDTARDLRKLELAARRLDARNGMDEQLQRAAGEIGVMRQDGALELADRVRLVEILAGPDMALALLDAGA